MREVQHPAVAPEAGAIPSGHRRTALTGFKRGARGRCPHCGEGRLFTAYLKIRPACEVCGHDNGQYPADDAPPYFTILIVGHLVIGPLLAFPFIWQWPAGVVVAILVPSVVALSLALLPIVKGAVVGALWAVAKPADGLDPRPEEAATRPVSTRHDPSLDIQ